MYNRRYCISLFSIHTNKQLNAEFTDWTIENILEGFYELNINLHASLQQHSIFLLQSEKKNYEMMLRWNNSILQTAQMGKIAFNSEGGDIKRKEETAMKCSKGELLNLFSITSVKLFWNSTAFAI